MEGESLPGMAASFNAQDHILKYSHHINSTQLLYNQSIASNVHTVASQHYSNLSRVDS